MSTKICLELACVTLRKKEKMYIYKKKTKGKGKEKESPRADEINQQRQRLPSVHRAALFCVRDSSTLADEFVHLVRTEDYI